MVNKLEQNEALEVGSLNELWSYTDALHASLYPESQLKPIMGGGKTKNPKVMFVFINPTVKNISSDPLWEGKRRPWTGTKYIWKIFNRAGLFPTELLKEIQIWRTWDIDFADRVYNQLAKDGFYFTNIVKWTGENGDLPDASKIKNFLPILKKELELVEPEYILTFGLIPFVALTGEKIKLADYYEEVIRTNKLRFYSYLNGEKSYKVIPCYFPVGRGDPKRAVDILNLLRGSL